MASLGWPAFTTAPNSVAPLFERRASTSGSPKPFVHRTHRRPSSAAAIATAGLLDPFTRPMSGALGAPIRHTRIASKDG
jgi:hypothetical protein